MQKYDAALKSVLTRRTAGFLSRLMGLEVAGFLNSDLSEVRSQRVDLLGQATDGTLFHVELQSTNEKRMAFRMLEYLAAIEGKFGQIPRQMVLYVGQAAMRMESRIETAGLSFQVDMMDIRELDGEALLESDNLDENIVSVLTRQPDGRRAVRRILEKIGASDLEHRAKALRELMILAGLRNLGNFVEEESERMPILDDIMDHDFLGPLMRRSIATGERTLFLKLAAKRFGPVPEWVKEHTEQLSNEELEDLGVRLLDVKSLDELFGAR